MVGWWRLGGTGRAMQQRLGAVELLRDAVSGGSGEWLLGV